MKRLVLGIAVIALATFGLAAIAGEGGTWVADDGNTFNVSTAHAMFIGEDEGANVFNLDELADGETRTFGSGDKQVTVSRNGDKATILREETREESRLEVTCVLGQDTCRVMTFDEDPEKVMVMIAKTRECVNGVGNCEHDMIDLDAIGGEGHAIMIKRFVSCDDDGNCEETEDHFTHGAPGQIGAAHQIMIETLGEVGEGDGDHLIMVNPGMHVGSFHAKDSVTLACPEGDAHMTVKLDEADDVYLCPKHSVPLEQIKFKTHRVKIGSEAN